MTRRTIWIGLSFTAAVVLVLLLVVILASPVPRERKIALTAPTGGTEWIAGSKQTVSWAADNISGVRVELSRDGGATWEEMAASVPAATGSCALTVTPPHSAECIVRVSDASDRSLAARSRVPFTIAQRIRLVAPKGGEAWPAGSRQRISWASEGVTDVRLEISRDGGGNWEEIIASIPAAIGSCSWKVAGRASTDCIIRVSDAADGSPAARSDRPFAIKREVHITTPAAGVKWPIGTTREIAWSAAGVTSVRRSVREEAAGA